jgi:hypothetical protein
MPGDYHIQADRPLPDFSLPPPMPVWLCRRVLKPDERVMKVYGPRFTPSWERWITHPSLFLVALVLGVVVVAVGWPLGGGAGGSEESPVRPLVVMAAIDIVLGSIFVLGHACGYFTRLVVTHSRKLILQGHEVCRSWGIEALPAALLRYHPLPGGGMAPTIDLDSLKTMLGSQSDRIADSKTILAFGKQLDRIKPKDDRRL